MNEANDTQAGFPNSTEDQPTVSRVSKKSTLVLVSLGVIFLFLVIIAGTHFFGMQQDLGQEQAPNQVQPNIPSPTLIPTVSQTTPTTPVDDSDVKFKRIKSIDFVDSSQNARKLIFAVETLGDTTLGKAYIADENGQPINQIDALQSTQVGLSLYDETALEIYPSPGSPKYFLIQRTQDPTFFTILNEQGVVIRDYKLAQKIRGSISECNRGQCGLRFEAWIKNEELAMTVITALGTTYRVNVSIPDEKIIQVVPVQ